MKPKEEVPFTLRPATRADAGGLTRLILALAEYEKLPPPNREAQDRLIEDGLGAQPRFETWLAFWGDEKQPVGYAIFFETYSTFLARPTLFLEDLFVSLEYRRRGIGTALLHRCIGLARERGCGRMEWTCLDWNTKAQRAYERLGARRLSEWLLYRLDQAGLETSAQENRNVK